METIKTILVDDVETIHTAVKDYIEGELNCEVIDEAYNGEQFLELDKLTDADIILMDIEMPGIGGIEASKEVLWKYPFLKLIAITMYQEKAYMQSLIEAGFKGCVFKQDLFKELGPAIEVVMKGRLYFPEEIKL